MPRGFRNFMIITRDFPCYCVCSLSHLFTVFSSEKLFCFYVAEPKFATMGAQSWKLGFSILENLLKEYVALELGLPCAISDIPAGTVVVYYSVLISSRYLCPIECVKFSRILILPRSKLSDCTVKKVINTVLHQKLLYFSLPSDTVIAEVYCSLLFANTSGFSISSFIKHHIWKSDYATQPLVNVQFFIFLLNLFVEIFISWERSIWLSSQIHAKFLLM